MLSVIINVKNGEKYLARCLNALIRFDDIVVLDNYSTDNTLAIAKTFSQVRIFQVEFCGMGKLRNLAASYAKYDWLFVVDSDEIANHALVDYLVNLSFNYNCVYQVFRHNFYDNFRLDASSWDNDWVTRIYNRRQTCYNETDVHESVNLTNLKVCKIYHGYLYHFPYDNIAQLINKLQFYSTLYAKQNFGKKNPKLYLLPLRTFSMFFKCYILKRGFLYGYEGLVISMLNAIGVFIKYIKLYELSYKRKIALAVEIIQNTNELRPLINWINQQTFLPHQVLVLISDDLLEQEVLINKLLTENLIVPSKIIGKIGQSTNSLLNNYLINQPHLNNIVYIANSKVLSNQKLFKQCKTAILKTRLLPAIEVFTKEM